MSERTFVKRCCRSRASAIEAFNLLSSCRCSVKTSRCLDRLLCFSVDDVSSESSIRASCDIKDSRCESQSDSTGAKPSHLFNEFLNFTLDPGFIFGRFGRQIRSRHKL